MLDEYLFDEAKGLWVSPYQQLIGKECLALFYRKPSSNADKGYFTSVFDEIYPPSEGNEKKLENSFIESLDSGYIQVADSSVYFAGVKTDVPF